MEGKEILVLAGSPRINGNSDMLADAFIEGAKKAGHSVTKIYVAAHKVNGCLGCNKCWSDGTHCIQKDDMVKLYPAFEKATVLVFATPLYYYSWSAQLKCVLDRTFTYASPDRKFAMAVKECALLVAAETSEVADLDGLVGSYRIAARFCHWKDKGMLLATGVYEKGAVKAGDWLERARKMGMEI